MGPLEIERKFIVPKLPEDLLASVPGETIRQGYLLLEAERELRIRDRNGEFRMTLKQGSGLARNEQECLIPADQFAMLWPLTKGKRIEKTRYAVNRAGLVFEVDVFSGQLAPLILLEVEFPSLQASREFSVPAFVEREVTDDRAYKNSSLATAGLPDHRN